MSAKSPSAAASESGSASTAMPAPRTARPSSTLAVPNRLPGAGAGGFLLKDTRAADILHVIKRAAAGEPILSPAVTDARRPSTKTPG
ncbi:hypothetical protein [Allorhizocola rhizosphaerae]|uniref:hypothetical protein n=1 Tax=Allorhizocola rhizosphaerae TaxID=1872709 RepID=UPI001B8C0762